VRKAARGITESGNVNVVTGALITDAAARHPG
jgi:hypothetical protein